MLMVVQDTILYDKNVSPIVKLIHIWLMTNAKGGKVRDAYPQIAKDLEYEGAEVMPEQFFQGAVKELESKGYIKTSKNTIEIVSDFEPITSNISSKPKEPKKKATKSTKISQETLDIMDYLFEARIARGYSKTLSKDKSFREAIQARLNDGYTYDDAIKVINYAFLHSEWLRGKPQFLLPPTLFRRSNFPKYLANAEAIPGIREQTIEKIGSSTTNESEEEEVVCSM